MKALYNLWHKSLTPPLFAAMALLLLLLSSNPVYADSASTGNKAFDNEVAALSELESTNDFGQQIINWIAYGHPKGLEGIDAAVGASGGSLLGHLAFTLSAISLIVMAALAALGGINYTIHTANRGMPGGQIISSFWMPIRISVATILLVPIAGGVGYSTIHLGVIKVAEMGSAHAGYLAGQALDYIGTKGVYTPPHPGGGTQVVNALILSELCKQYVNANEKLDESRGVYSQQSGRLIKYEKSAKGFMRTGWMEKENYCGALAFTGESALPSALGPIASRAHGSDVAKLLATTPPDNMRDLVRPSFEQDELGSELAKYTYETIRPKAAAIAEQLMSDQASLEALIETGSGQNSSAEITFKNNQKAAHESLAAQSNAINALIKEYNEYAYNKILEDAQAIAGGGSNWVSEVKEAGWPAFGMIFWHASQLQQKINERMKAYFPIVTKPHPTDGYEEDERWFILTARLYDAQSKASRDNPEEDFNLESLVDSGDPNWLSSGGQRYLARFFSRMFIIPSSEDANAVTRLQSTGYTILALSEGAIFGSMIANSAAAGAHAAAEAAGRGVSKQTDGWIKFVPGLGNLAQGAATAGEATIVGLATFTVTAVKEFVSYFRYLMGPVIVAGFALAIVLPTIPAMFWLLGVISYMLFFVQCLLVSTFWLAAHGTAEGQGWGSEHTRQGYLLMLGLYLSPILRVAGFAAMLLVIMPVGVLMQWMLNYVFGVASTNIVMTPFMTIGALVVVTVFAYSAFVRIFALPSELFEHGLRWINGGQEVTGDSHAEGHSRILIAQFSSQFSQGQMRRQAADDRIANKDT